ncbi:MAG: acyl-CoA dehydrogenase family protein [Pseudomonadales bacterium]|nr:acyl-CoA dehydrogenase family protein [Pseudomonadales bacterium]
MITDGFLSADDIRRNVISLCDDLRDRDLTAEFDSERRLPGDIVERLRSAGVFRMNMPRIWGGPEMTSPEQVEIVEMLSAADASVGWCAFIWCDSGIYSGYLEDAVARALYPRLDMAQSGWVYPAGRADRVEGGYRVNARWIFGSGCNHCDMLAGGCTVYEGDVPKHNDRGRPEWRIMLAPRDSYRIEDTWYTTGLRGTGSHDYVAEDLFIPDAHSFSFFEPAHREGPLWRRPDTLLRKMSGVPLGVARNAIDRAVSLLEGKTDRVTRQPYRQLREVQQAVARAEAQLGAARAYVYGSLETQWQCLEQNRPLTVKERADTFLARQHAFQTGRAVVQLIYDTIGGASVYVDNPFDRPLRDMITACQHVVAQEKTLASVGSLLLGADEDRGML